MPIEIRPPAEDELRAAMAAAESAFGGEVEDEDWEREQKILPASRALAAYDGGRPVALTAAYAFELTIPGGQLPCAGVTWVGVLPSHRRQGILRDFMKRQLADVQGWGEPIAALWASEAAIYGRFGYGLAAPGLYAKSDCARFALRDDRRPAGLDSARRRRRGVPALPAGVRAGPAGAAGDADAVGDLVERAASRRLEGAGGAERARSSTPSSSSTARWRATRTYRVKERVGGRDADAARFASSRRSRRRPTAERELWRFLHNVDLTIRVDVHSLDPASPILLTVPRHSRTRPASSADGLWLRFVDLDAALKARSYRAGRVRRARSHATSSARGMPAATASATMPAAPTTRPTSRSTQPTSPPRTSADSTSTGSSTPAAPTSAARAPPKRRRCSSAPTCRLTARRCSEVAWEVRPTTDLEEFVDAVGAISHYFGSERDLERAERFAQRAAARADARGLRRRPDRRRCRARSRSS